MLRGWLDHSTTSITKAAVILGAASLLSRVLGLLRDRLLTHNFGAGWELDAYYAAFRLPDFLYNLLILGALSAAFIPLFTKYLVDKSEERAWRFMNISLSVLGTIFLGLSVLCIAAAPLITYLVAPGFDQEKMHLTVVLTRWMLLSPIFLGLSAVISGALQALKKFLLYALAPIFYNLGIIIGLLVFVPWWGPVGLGWGVVLGALLHLLVQIPSLWRAGYRPHWIFSWHDKDIRDLLRLMGPRTLALATTQINFIIITVLASKLDDGAVTIFNLANNIQWLPVGIIAVSYGVAAFPLMSEYAAAHNPDGLAHTVAHTLRTITVMLLPTMILFLLLRAQWVRLIFGSGKFDWTATVLTADTLALFALGIIGQGWLPILARGFYALKDTATPAIVGVLANLLGIILSLILMRPLGVAGLALAYSINATVNAIALWILLRKKTGTLEGELTLYTFYKISAAGLLMGLVVQGLKRPLGLWLGTKTFVAIFTETFLAALVGLLAFTGVSLLLKVPEVYAIVDAFKTRLKKFVAPPPDISDINSVR